VRDDPNYVRVRHTDVEIRSELAVPLLFQDRLVGVLDLESTELDAFTQEHEKVLTMLASHVAIALENARLYGRVLAEEQRLEHDLETAREIQKGLLPGSPPRIRGAEIGTAYLPAKILGGDFFDFLSYGNGRLALAVGDVSGKATPAALYSSLAVGQIRGHALGHTHDPAEMLALLNNSLQRRRLDNRFAAMAFAVYDPAGPSLTIANSGFPRPLLVRSGKTTPLPVTGVPLGLLPDRIYEEIRVDLRVGDLVVFCSDGVQEPADADAAQFGSERFEQLLITLSDLAAAQIAKAILRTTDLYLGEWGEPPDDRTVVVLKVTGEEP
jgi:sigma-B regulation protein RsbU (phosphoserine phosphatase)